VDVSIFEVGIGGTYDSTNVVPRPLVTGVTALGLDHVSILGKTIEEIAEQKGGIFKVNLLEMNGQPFSYLVLDLTNFRVA
jgi:folylpolyglutamate synthase/dihydropteroate synthase